MAFRLCLIVCLVSPPVSWGAMGVAGAEAGCSAVAAPAAAQLVRETAKANKTFSTSSLAIAEAATLQRPSPIGNGDDRELNTASSLDLDSPPLAPRPPPHRLID